MYSLKKVFVISVGKKFLHREKGHLSESELLAFHRANRFIEQELPNLEIISAEDTRQIDCFEASRKHGILIQAVTPEWFSHFKLNNGALGCFLSHLKIWQRIKNMQGLHDSDYFLILEDDVCTQEVKTLSAHWHSACSYAEINPWIFELHHRGKNGSEAYAINKKGADFLLSHIINHTIPAPLDKFLWVICREKKPEVYYTYKSIHIDKDFLSTLSEHKEKFVAKYNQRIELKQKQVETILQKIKNNPLGSCSLSALFLDGTFNSRNISFVNDYIGNQPKKLFEAFEDNGDIYFCEIDRVPAGKNIVTSIG